MLTNNPSYRNKSLRARMKVAHVELFRRDARLVPRYAVTATYGNRERRIQERISDLRRKKSKAKEQFCKSIPIVLRDLHTSKYRRPRNRPYDACLWKPAECYIDRTSKQLRIVASAETFNGNQALKNCTEQREMVRSWYECRLSNQLECVGKYSDIIRICYTLTVWYSVVQG